MSASAIAVVDTNVLVSGFPSSPGPPGRIVEWLRTGVVQAGLDDRILAEYGDVLHRPELALPAREVDVVLDAIVGHACWARVLPEHALRGGLPDPDDAPFVECALALGCTLVTGNVRHYPAAAVKEIVVLTPRAFVEGLGT
ncbi:MAG: PIN domain-containing protein [Lentisphaeria bacterium]|nr:PIN domain-containing protein [Lentisphaeria bacterium]